MKIHESLSNFISGKTYSPFIIHPATFNLNPKIYSNDYFSRMMKFLQTIGILFFLIYSAQLSAQQIKSTPLTYSSTFIFEGYSQKELYVRAKKWFSGQLQDPSSIIEVDKEDKGQLIGSSSFGYSDPRIEYGTEYNTLNGTI